MTVRQISISELKAHCTEQIRAVERDGVVLHVTRHGKHVATIRPGGAEAFALAGSGREAVTMLRDDPVTATAPAWQDKAQDVWTPLTAEQHAKRQGVRRVANWEDILGDGTEEEWEGFDEALEQWRQELVRFDEDLA